MTNNTATQEQQKNTTVHQAQKGTASSAQLYLRIAEIRDDTVVLKNGGIRSILDVTSINFNLKSEDEQNAIIYSYQNFLNSLEFPIQIIVRSRKLDIDNYIDELNGLGEKQTNELLQRQTYEYMDYIQRLVEYADIMEKQFLVVVPYDPFRAVKPNVLQRFFQNMQPKDSFAEVQKRHKEFLQLKKGLNQRINVVKSGLESCGLQVNQLKTHDLIELFYEIYNPLTSRNQKIEELESIKLQTDEDVLDEEKRNEIGLEEG
ncbi:hypothetical protein JW911_00435 [Candidatus Peregrinibacteria bacterium]|nr:hypothetical protein [Candidatus Peregrinibacteria bacterium]